MNIIVSVSSIVGPLTRNKSFRSGGVVEKKEEKKEEDIMEKSIDAASMSITKVLTDTTVQPPIDPVVPQEISWSSSSKNARFDTYSSEDSSTSEVSLEQYLPDDFDDEASNKNLSKPPIWSSLDFHVLTDNQSTSWSIHCLDKNYRAESDTMWFRLFRNDNPRTAVFLEGEEVLFTLDGILEYGQALLFYVHFASCADFVRLGEGSVRCFLERALYVASTTSSSENMAALVHQQQKEEDHLQQQQVNQDDKDAVFDSIWNDPSDHWFQTAYEELEQELTKAAMEPSIDSIADNLLAFGAASY